MHALVRRPPGFLAFSVSVPEPLQHPELEVVEQILVCAAVVGLQDADRVVHVAGGRLVQGPVQLGVVAAESSAAGQAQHQAERWQRAAPIAALRPVIISFTSRQLGVKRKYSHTRG